MKQTHIIYAVVTAIVMIILSVALYMGGMALAKWAKYVVMTPFLIGILLNAVAFSKANNEFVTFGNVFGSGFKATALVTIIMLIWAFVSLAIFPDMITKAMDNAHEEMVKKGTMTDDQIDAGMEFARNHFKTIMVMFTLTWYVFWGVIFSLIGGAIAKKKGNSPFQDAQSV